MQRDGNIMICTIGELAHSLAEKINLDNVGNSEFLNCDFCLINPAARDKNIAEIETYTDTEDWHGIKRLNTGFDSFDLLLACDYYGSRYGTLTILTLWSGMDEDITEFEGVPHLIEQLIIDTLIKSRSVWRSEAENDVTENSMLLVIVREEKPI